MKIKYIYYLLLTFYILNIFSCDKILPESIPSDQALDAPLEGLTDLQRRVFLAGAEEFEEIYIQSTGLGPIFVSSSCVSCHKGDNRGTLSTILTRFGQSDTIGNNFLRFGGPQLQHISLPGYEGEKIPQGATSTKLIAPIVSGSGFLELVSEEDLIALSDPEDKNKDGISGRINWNTIPEWVTPSLNSKTINGKYICRFGKKAGTYNLHQQVVQAFNQDIGITTTFMPTNPVNYLTGTNPTTDMDIDITDESLNATVFYIQTLQTPYQRNQNEINIIEGKKIFESIRCNACHVEKLKTTFSNVEALSNKEFYPYTDLLLHDMGPGLDDHYTEGTALTSEWRTAPLWGLGLTKNVQNNKYNLMHDGRARSIDEAILLHQGESSASTEKYQALTSEEKIKLIQFLESL